MPTTSPAIVDDFLRLLKDEGIPFAVLHGEESLAEMHSDVDLVSAVPAGELLRRLAGKMTQHRAVMLWPYERGGAANLFVATKDLSEGAQIDVLFDPLGRGRLGLRSGALLESAVDGRRFPTVDRATQLLYLIRKRIVKGQGDRLPGLVTEAQKAVDTDRIISRVAAPRASASIEAALSGAWSGGPQDARPSPALLFDRLRRPIGYWIHFSDSDDGQRAAELDRRVARVFPHHGLGLVPPMPARIRWWTSQVGPVRLRAGVFSSWGPWRGIPSPDLVLGANSQLDRAVDWMAARTLERAQR